MAADVVADILATLGFSALDPQSESGIFSRERARRRLSEWRAYRDHVMGDGRAS
jgi:hypothetical protein